MARPRRIPVLLPLDRRVTWFLTFCVRPRRPVLACAEVWAAWCGAVERLSEWQVAAAVVMPDHVHLLARPLCERDQPVGNLVGALKRWTRAPFGDRWQWQVGSFDRLLRSDESAQQKWLYIWQNPVSAGLVAEAEDWPYWFAEADIALEKFRALPLLGGRSDLLNL